MTAPMDRKPTPRGHLFVLSAPSGAGKTTLSRKIRQIFDHMIYSVSYTTRQPRSGEVDGVDYYFIGEPEFQSGVDSGRWAEWARVHGNYYGTSAHWIRDALSTGKDVLLDIDVQGAAQIRESFPDAVTLFILPPSVEILRQRLEQRGTDDPDEIERRLAAAVQEMSQQDRYRHIVVNDRLSDTIDEMVRIIGSYGSE
jgi:guanylate kinase